MDCVAARKRQCALMRRSITKAPKGTNDASITAEANPKLASFLIQTQAVALINAINSAPCAIPASVTARG